uniref:Probable magnesium transporter n=1 Tax=Daucus carota subsp. sativus TaxID=79200 RepID=A0A166ERS1_DAUCS
MWEAILLTLAATAGNNIGKVIRAYVFNKPWISGFLMDIFGAMLMLRALSLAPVSVIQPVSGCGLAILSIFSHYYLKEMMNAVDWVGITLAGIGTIGVGAGGEDQEASAISIFHLPWLAFVVAFMFVGHRYGLCKDIHIIPEIAGPHMSFNLLVSNFVSFSLNRREQTAIGCFAYLFYYGRLGDIRGRPSSLSGRQRKEQELMQSEVVEEIIYGLESGILFGIASVISKMGFLFLEQGFSRLLVPVCVSISICCSGTGFVYQTRGLKHGRAIVVSTCAAVASIVTGVLAGMLALGERLPSAPVARLWLLLGWLLIITGVILLVCSTRLLRYIPRPWRRTKRSSVDKTFGLRRAVSLHSSKDTSPSAVIQATTLHHLITPPRQKGFRKVDPDRWEFANEGFLGGQKHLLKTIKRRRNATSQGIQQQGGGLCVELGHYGVEEELQKLGHDRSILSAEIVKLRQQQQDSQNVIAAMEDKIQSLESKQQRMMSFLAQALRSPEFMQQYLDKYVQKMDQNQIDMGRKRRLTMSPSQSLEDLQTQSLDYSYQQKEELANTGVDVESFFSDALDPGATSGVKEEMVSSRGGELDAVNEIIWEELLDNNLATVNAEKEEVAIDLPGVEVEDFAANSPDWDSEDLKPLIDQLEYLRSNP